MSYETFIEDAVTPEGLERLAPDVRWLADIEGLGAHRLSVDIRLSESQHS